MRWRDKCSPGVGSFGDTCCYIHALGVHRNGCRANTVMGYGCSENGITRILDPNGIALLEQKFGTQGNRLLSTGSNDDLFRLAYYSAKFSCVICDSFSKWRETMRLRVAGMSPRRARESGSDLGPRLSWCQFVRGRYDGQRYRPLWKEDGRDLRSVLCSPGQCSCRFLLVCH